MSKLEFFDRNLQLATEQLTGEAISAELAKFAREELGKAIKTGEASEQYDRFVNGQPELPEEAVEAPGPILYVFNDWPVIIATALGELQKRAPRRSGRFASSFIVIVGGQVVEDFRSIGLEDEVIITNFQPYIRHVEAGNSGVARRRVFDGTKRWLNYRYRGVVETETRFLSLAGGIHGSIPYVLKRGHRRKERQAGQPITYPAIIMNLS